MKPFPAWTIVLLLLLPLVTSPGLGDVPNRPAASENTFTFHLFHTLAAAHPAGNVFVSPCSAAQALGMAALGAGGTTRRAMQQALGGSDVPSDASVHSDDPRVQLAAANDLWADRAFHFRPAFTEAARRIYGAGVATLDFQSASSVGTINRRISQETQGKITDLLNSDDLSRAQGGAILTDAVYFHGPWTQTFDKYETRPGPFASTGGPITVPLMARTGEMPYWQGDDFQAVELAYGDGRFVMDVFLPGQKSSLTKLLGRLNALTWQAWMSRLQPAQVALTLPRIHVSTAEDLEGPLTALGMGIAFQRQADFTPMSPQPLRLGGVKQEALLDVDENGTTAAAATAVVVMPGAAPQEPPSVVMRVDRPFFCAIRDTRTGTIVFVGAITDPR